MDLIFTQYDKLISSFSPASQAFISLALLLFLMWQIYMVIKHGHWIFIAALILFLPGTWPATQYIGGLILTVIKLLFVRVGLLFF
ncbi:MAG: hypothetical protein WC536_03910 [Patescibacteria group bacterium]